MKKLMTMMVVLAVVCHVANANEENPKAETGVSVIKSGTIVKLFYKGSKAEDVKVAIRNEAGLKVFEEKIRKHESFMRPYNFSSLAEGEYTIEVETSEGKQVQRVNYNNRQIERLMYVMPVVNEEGKFVLAVSNKGRTSLGIQILNDDGDVVYTGREDIVNDFAKVYNVKELQGSFTFVVTDARGNSKTLKYKR